VKRSQVLTLADVTTDDLLHSRHIYRELAILIGESAL